MTPHVVPTRTYAAIFGSLIVLTLVTTGIAFIDLRWQLGSLELNTIVALTIAVGKAFLVGLYFMHIRYSSRFTWVLVGAGVFWLLILFTFTLSDALTRSWLPVPPPWGLQTLP